jgi:cytochrome P450
MSNMQVQFDPFDHDTHDNPYPIYRSLRDDAPAYFNEKFGFWVLSRYDDCFNALRDFKTYCNRFGQTLEPTAPGILPILLLMDPPDHTRVRKVVSRVLTPERVAHLEGSIRALAVELLAPFRCKGSIDIIGDFSAKLPMAIIARMLQVPQKDEDLLRGWTDDAVHRDDGVFKMPERGVESCQKLFAYFAALIEERKHHLDSGGGDLLSLLILAQQAEEISYDEMLGFCFLLAIAGNETTTKLIGNVMYQLDAHPDQRRKLLGDLSLLPAAIEEVMRLDGPTQMQARTLTRDVELHGQTMKEGAKVAILFVSANRDERHYKNAEAFDITRNPRDHLGFGGGIHACIGAALARLEVKVACEELFKVMPDFVVDKSGLQRMHSPNVRGFTHVPVNFTPHD